MKHGYLQPVKRFLLSVLFLSASALSAQDVGVSAIISPLPACGLSSTEAMVVEISNYGFLDQTAFDVGYMVTGPTGTFMGTDNIGSTVVPGGGSINWAFTTSVDFSAVGTYTITSWTDLVGDVAISNDTIVTSLTILGMTLPDVESFDLYPSGTTVFDEWINDPGAPDPFQVSFGTTPSIATGPTGDVNGSGGYIYCEASSMAFGDSASIISNCIDLSSGTAPKLAYAYHMFGDAIGGLRIYVESSDTTRVVDLIGQQQFSNADPWAFDTVDLSPWLGSSIRLRITGYLGFSGTVFNGDISLDQVEVLNPVPNDIGVIDVLSPLSSCGTTAPLTVRVDVQNFGTLTQTGFPINYEVNGPTGMFSASETFTGTLDPGEVEEYTFASSVDFSLDGIYTVSVWTGLALDEQPINDSIAEFVDNFPTAADLAIGPFGDDFDTYADGTTVFTDFTNDPDAALDFEVNFGGTTSTGTGPDDDASGGGGYIYMETSGSSVGDIARICTGCIELAGTLAPEVEFKYHMFGAAVGAMRVTVISPDSVSTAFELVGQQQFSNSDPWLQGDVDLIPWMTQSIQVCFEGEVGVGGSTFTSDIALDEIQLKDVQPDDLGVNQVISPQATGCDLSAVETVTVVIENFGTSVQTGFDVGYTVDGPLGMVAVTENVGALTLMGGEIDTFTFAATVDMSVNGSYLLKSFTTLSTDAIPGNDTTTVAVVNETALTSFPLEVDFETWTICGTTCSADCSAAVNDGWRQDPDDDGDWLPHAGTTSSTATGPSADFLPGTSAGIYLYTEASGTCTNSEHRIISPCVDISSLSTPGVQFWYHMFGVDQGTLAVDVSDDNGLTWTEAWSRSGQDQLATTDPWKAATVPLLGYGSTIQIRFRGITGPGFNSDMAIDAVKFFDIPPFDDAGVIEVVDPALGCDLTSSEVVSIAIRNTGTTPLLDIDVVYEVSGPVSTPPVTEGIGATLIGPGVTDTFTFATPVDLSIPGVYTIRAWSSVPSDTVAFNDTTTRVIEHLPTIVPPSAEDFDSYAIGETDFDFMRNNPELSDPFQVNTGGTTSTGTGPATDASGTGNYIYMEASGMGSGEQAQVCIPCLNLGGGAGNPRLEFAYHMFGSGIGSLDVTVTDETGAETTMLSLVGQQQLGSTAPWQYTVINMDTFLGQTVQVCWTGTVGSSGTAFESDISIDEISIKDPLPNDLAVTDVISPDDACLLTTGEPVTIRIENVGVNDQWDFEVGYSIDGGAPLTETVPDTLSEGESLLYTFSALADLSVEGAYLVSAWSALAGDDQPLNDSTDRVVTHVPTVVDFPYIEDFESGGVGWVSSGIKNTWELATPMGLSIASASSGAFAWVTDADGDYNDDERSQVLSPCLDLSSMDNPGMKIDLNFLTQAGVIIAQDGFVIQSSVDGGATWKNVGAFGDPMGWFNFNNVIANPGDQLPLLTSANGWGGVSGGWSTATHALDGLGGETSVILRIAFASDNFGAFEGVAFDDVIIADMPSIALGPDTSVCAGHVLDAGFIAGATYDWSTGATGQTVTVTSTGLYQVTVTDSLGFSSTDEVNVTLIPSPSVDLGPDDSFCESVVLDAGNPGSSYFWNTGLGTQTITATTSGTYSVIVTSPEGCVSNDEIVVTVEYAPVASFTFDLGGPFATFFDASPGATSWTWDFGDGGTSAEQNPAYTYEASGNYTVTLIVSNACGSDTLVQSVAIFVSSLEDADLASSWTVFPNPTDGLIQMQIEGVALGEEVLYGLFDASGKMVASGMTEHFGSLDFRRFASGHYTLRIAAGERQASKTLQIE